jgi:hypothetical protein
MDMLTPAQKAALKKHIHTEAVGAAGIAVKYFGLDPNLVNPAVKDGTGKAPPFISPSGAPKTPIGSPKTPSGPSGKDVGDAKEPWTSTYRMDLNLETAVNVQGKKIGGAVARHSMEIAERSGSKLTPWQRVQIVEKGVTPSGMGA